MDILHFQYFEMDVPDDADPSRYIALQAVGFKMGGMWVEGHHRTWMNCLQTFYKCFVIIFVLILPMLGQALYLVFDATPEEFFGSLNILLTDFFVAVKLCNFMYHRVEFIQLMEHLRSEEFAPTQLEHLDIVRRGIRWGRLIATVFYVVYLLNVAGFCVVPVVNGERRMSTTIDFLIFDISKTPNYEIVYFFHIIYKSVIVIIFVAIQTTPPALMSCAIAQLDILIFNLENMPLLIKRRQIDSGCGAEQAATELMRGFVIHHKSILRYAERVEATFGPQFFVQFFCTCIIICTTGAAIMTIDSAKESIAVLLWNLTYLINTFIDVYITCAFGNAVTTKSVDLTTAAYRSGWLEREAPLKRSLLVFMARTQRPLVLRAGNYFGVSLATYASMMNWTYKAFAIINQTSD